MANAEYVRIALIEENHGVNAMMTQQPEHWMRVKPCPECDGKGYKNTDSIRWGDQLGKGKDDCVFCKDGWVLK